MKRMILLAILAVVCAAWAQPAEKKGPAKPAAKAAAHKPGKVARKNRRHEDARHCLELPNNTEIIKCAEAYL